jgi:hypothetical protein
MKSMVFPVSDSRLPAPAVRPDDVAIAGAAAADLNADQRQRLARCALRAFKAQEALGLLGGTSFDDWRHARVREATGQGGLRELKQRDYGRVMARMIELAGGTPSRREWRVAAKPAVRDDADRARRKLEDECAALADAFGGEAQAKAYATTLLGRIHKTDWTHATARQLWQVLFTLRNRSRSKNRPGCAARPLRPEPCLGASGALEAASPVFPAASCGSGAGIGGQMAVGGGQPGGK